MSETILAASILVAALNAIPAVLGGLRWYREELSSAFWVLLRIGQGSALTLALAVGSLALAGKYSSDRLFYLYSLLPLAIAFVAEQLRLASAQTILDQHELRDAQHLGELPEAQQHQVAAAIMRREMGVMALSALVVVFLALRAAGTAQF